LRIHSRAVAGAAGRAVPPVGGARDRDGAAQRL
jgi:hypothetical protein